MNVTSTRSLLPNPVASKILPFPSGVRMRGNIRVDSRHLSRRARSRLDPNAFRRIVIALLVTVAPTAFAAPAIAHAASSVALPTQAVKPPPTVWGACPSGDRAAAELKLVRRFDRAPGVTKTGQTMPGGASELLCGTDRYGYYHIVVEHHVEWTQKSVMSNENWREVADYSIAEALRSPMSITFRASNNTFCYSREVSLVDRVRGITVDVMHPNVVVRAQDGAVITAFPARTPC